MDALALILLLLAICCLATILFKRNVKWHHDIIFTDKGKEKLDSFDIMIGLVGLVFFGAAAISFFLFNL
jgi:hypothetical protein